LKGDGLDMDWIKEHKVFIFAGIATVLFLIYSSFDSERDQAEVNEEMMGMADQGGIEEKEALADSGGIEEKDDLPKQPPAVMMADIKGAVVHPGVYIVAEGNRVIDLIALAGGLAEDADSATVNFSMHVADEMVIYIPKKGEEASSLISPQSGQVASEKRTVNLNTADSSELETLPGIGPAKSAAILEYRNVNGPYKSIEDLKSISGIGDKTFEKLKELISVK
jgi:competence protein ComEA